MSRLEQVKQAATPTQTKKPQTIAQMLADPRYQDQIGKALPKHISAERLGRIALTEVRKNPELGNCDHLSLFGAVLQCAQLGLEPGGALGHAYLLPFKNNRENRMDVQFIIGYRGMIDLARRSGQIMSLQSHVVYEGDKFEFAYGLDEKLEHIPSRDVSNRGNIVAVYAVAKLQGGGYQIEVMWKEEVDLIKAKSKAGKFGPWIDHYEEMAKKTVIRRLFKYLPVSIELQKATSLDEQAESNVDQGNHYMFDENANIIEGEEVTN